jgi:hypothetical protein
MQAANNEPQFAFGFQPLRLDRQLEIYCLAAVDSTQQI